MHSSHRAPRAVLAALLAAIVALVLATGASAAVPGDTCPLGTVNLAPSCFEGADGNLADDSAALFDWHTLGGSAIATADGTGGSDFIFSGGSKEQKPTTWALVQQSAPGKDDLLAAASYVDTVQTLTGAHVFFYGAFERKTNTGNANLSFELNQVKATFDNDNNPSTPEVPVRTEGDLLITYDGNSTGGIRLGACVWHGSERGEADNAAYGWYPIDKYNGGTPSPADKIDSNSLCAEITASTTPAAIAAMNSATITGADQDLSPFSPTILHDNFGELAVDLTQVFDNAGVQHGCLSFGALFLHSRSSDTPTSAMKDYVEPQPLKPAADCGFTMDKRVGVGDETPRHTTSADPVFAHIGDTLHYDISVENTGVVPLALSFDDPACDAGTISGPDKTSGDADDSFEAGEVWTWHCSHVLTQADVGGPFWSSADGQFVNTASVHGTAEGFDETRQDSGYAEPYGRIVVDKQLTGDFGDADHQFGFDRYFGPTPGAGEPAIQNDPFTLSANDDPLQIGDVVANSTRPGIQYAVGEQADANYSLNSLACDDGETSPSQTSLGDRRADIVVSPGETVTCTFTNRRNTGTIDVVKDLVPADDAGRFDLQVDGVTKQADAGDGDSTGAVTLPTGDHTVGEAQGSQGQLDQYRKSIECRADGGQGAVVAATGPDDAGPLTVPVAKDDDIVCTVTNRKNAAVEVDKTEAGGPVTGDHVWTFRLTGLGDLAEFSQQHTVDASTPGGSVRWEDLQPGDYRLCELHVPAGWHSVFDSDGAVETANGDGTTDVCIDVTLGDGDVRTLVVDNRLPAIHVVKTGPAEAYPGDTVTFNYAVTSTGNTPLSDVAVTDAAGPFTCAPVTGPVSRQNDDGDALLEPTGVDGSTPEVWTFTCSTTVPAGHHIGDTNPLVDVATASGKDGDVTVTATSRHETTVLHPAIAIDKSGPAVVTAGSTINYSIEVTNPGDVAFAAEKVELTDELCKATLTLASKNGDASAGSLDPGDRWTYTCSYKTNGTEPPIVNVAVVKATDHNGRSVGAQDSVTTNQQAEAPEVASARLRGPSGCPTKAGYAYVTGTSIKKVVFYVDGKRKATVTKPNSKGRYQLRIVPRSMRYGSHTVKAVVTFSSGANARPKTMRLTFTRCRPDVTPQFTG